MSRTLVAQQSGTVPVRPPGHPSLPIGPAMALATKRAATAKNFILNVVVVIQQGVDRCMCKIVVVIVREDADEDEEKKLVDDGEEGRLYTFFSPSLPPESHEQCHRHLFHSIHLGPKLTAVLGCQYAGRGTSQSLSRCTMKGIGREDGSSISVA